MKKAAYVLVLLASPAFAQTPNLAPAPPVDRVGRITWGRGTVGKRRRNANKNSSGLFAAFLYATRSKSWLARRVHSRLRRQPRHRYGPRARRAPGGCLQRPHAFRGRHHYKYPERGHAMDNDLTLKAAALKLGFVTEAEFDRVVDPKKMVTSYVASDAPAPSAG